VSRSTALLPAPAPWDGVPRENPARASCSASRRRERLCPAPSSPVSTKPLYAGAEYISILPEPQPEVNIEFDAQICDATPSDRGCRNYEVHQGSHRGLMGAPAKRTACHVLTIFGEPNPPTSARSRRPSSGLETMDPPQSNSPRTRSRGVRRHQRLRLPFPSRNRET
jgi:hypothetical protein